VYNNYFILALRPVSGD